jgi:S1-C subfamily serine protease
MKSLTKLGFILLGLLAFIPRPGQAEITDTEQQSTVRIITLGRSQENTALPLWQAVTFTNGDTYYEYNWAAGTGFVINPDGYVLTNNHVVASDPESDENSDLILILQRVGDRYFLHRATVEKQDPNGDVAIVHAPTLKAAPLSFAPSEPSVGEDVFSIGFPGSADVAVTRTERENRINTEYLQWKLSDAQETPAIKAALEKWIAAFQKKNGRAPTQKEALEYAQEYREAYEQHWKERLSSAAHRGLAEFGDFLHDLDMKMRANPAANVYDVTDIVTQGQRANYLKPTVTKGSAERIAEKPGWLTSAITIPAIQINLHIMHGNSGGPLLNNGGQIIGVVGRGTSGHIMASADDQTEMLDWATTSGYLTSMLQSRHIAFILGPHWKPGPVAPPAWLIVAISIAIAVAIAALVIVLIRARRKTSLTKLLEALKAKGATSGTQLLELLGAKSKVQNGSSNRSRVISTPQAGNWKLDGRTPAGKTFQIPINENMFANNGSRLVLGRSAELCDLVVEDDTVSKQHAEIRKNGAGFVVADRNSSNGTAVNGVFSRKPFEAVPFKPGDTLTVGEVKLNFGKN